MIKGTTKVYGVIGNPIEHSLSPVMQNFYAQEAAVEMVYTPFLVSPASTCADDQAGRQEWLGQAIKGAYALNIQGLNVTVPYKQEIISCLAELDETAEAIGAVNTLVRIDSGYKGYNTDASGLLRALREEAVEIAGRHCVILGAGGAAKAAAYLLAKEKAASIYMINRNVQKAELLCREINALFHIQIAQPVSLLDCLSIPFRPYLVIQATNVGMHPHVHEAIITDPAFYKMVEIGVDVIYTPAQTSFMKRVEDNGGKAINGLSMLLYQGIAAFELWHPQVQLSQKTIAEAKTLLWQQLTE